MGQCSGVQVQQILSRQAAEVVLIRDAAGITASEPVQAKGGTGKLKWCEKETEEHVHTQM